MFYRHLVFWLAYSVQGTLLEYAWIHTVFAKEQQVNVILLAITFNLVLTPSRLLITYYALNVAVTQPLTRHYNVWLIFLKLSVALFVAIVLHRMGSIYYINPHEYPKSVYSFSDVFNVSWMFVSLLDLGYVAGIAVALRLFRMQILSLRNEKNLVKDKLETELKFLKNQINPHFLFNTLNNIYALARKKSDKTPEVVVRLAKLLRFMLYESAKDTIPIAEEIQILEDYVQLERLRYSNRLEVCFHKEIDDYNQLIAPLILLPFIENAFKHGVNDTINSTGISIKATLEKGQLAFVVKNSHDHDDNSPINENIGLSNVRRQLELMYTDFSLNTTNLAQIFIVDLKINLHSNGKI